MTELEEPLASFLDAEQTAASASGGEAGNAVRQAGGQADAPEKEGAQIYDFRNPMLLSPGELRKLRAHQKEFVQSAAARLSIHLGLEFSLKLTGVKTLAYQKLAEGWGRPAHLTLFKMEPLRGVSILEISSQLGLCMVDRLMGGPGRVPPTDQEMSEIEKVLLEQSVQLLLDEWCGRWSNVQELKPVILGYESNDGFIQSTPPETLMLVVSMEAGFGGCGGRIQMGFPCAVVDPLIRHFCKGAGTMASPTPPAQPPPAAAWKWNTCFDDVCVPVTAEWEGLEMTARQILALKVGDILPLGLQCMQHINVRVADMLKFQGRPGTLAGQWAVELTQAINR
jgi:flagellar motor switch protein FliM